MASTILPRVRDVAHTSSSRADAYLLHADYSGGPISFKFGSTSRKATGIAKVASLFLKKLFTEVGSNPNDVNEGTEFASLIGSNIGDEEEAILVIHESLRDASEQVSNDQVNQNLSEDEQLLSVKLTNYKFTTADAVELWIDLITVAGSSATVKVPKVSLA